MKKLLLTILMAAALLPARAQLFGPESLGGALWGGLIGGLVGADHRHGFSGNGAAIGAGVGLAVGAIAGEARRQRYYDSPGYYGYYESAPTVTVGYGYGHGYYGGGTYVYYAPNAYCAPNYYYRPSRPNYAVNGTLLGAASGALIGAGTHDAGKGAAIGAAAGLVLGGIAEATARQREQAARNVAPPLPTETGAQTPVVSTEITSQPCATSTYTWTARPQIADAPQVPDAPTF